MEILKEVLEGREERVYEQKRLLAEGDLVLQFALNIPGFPKRAEGDEALLLRTMRLFFRKFGEVGSQAPPLRLENGAGLAFLVAYSGRDAEEAKKSALAVETAHTWGRALDLDVITRRGSLSRGDLGLPPRRCLLCERDAKICARLGTHSLDELRKAVAALVLEGGD